MILDDHCSVIILIAFYSAHIDHIEYIGCPYHLCILSSIIRCPQSDFNMIIAIDPMAV